jgi:protein-tyrosine-phosphatase/DNA-binding transcriptional ArsR family regulator
VPFQPVTNELRAAQHAALGEPARLAVVDELLTSDRTPSELRQRLGLESNLLAHHLDVLQRVGLVARGRSSGDGRRRYVHLIRTTLDALLATARLAPQPALFVCTRNSARSQLAAALWRHRTAAPATSAGTHPANRVHPEAVAAARRAGLDLGSSVPRTLDQAGPHPDLVITVCDQAHEELVPTSQTWPHWSIADPVAIGSPEAFDAAVRELSDRIEALLVRTERSP